MPSCMQILLGLAWLVWIDPYQRMYEARGIGLLAFVALYLLDETWHGEQKATDQMEELR